MNYRNEPTDPLALTQTELSDIYSEIDDQPEWRATADKEMDYADGNQLDTDLLRKQRELGIPPAMDDVIGPQLRSVEGYEVNVRTDWRVTPDGQPGGQDVADALNFRLNQAERKSRADQACSDAFRPQIACGYGWVEVSRESDPFKYPYRCISVHRNEVHWDNRAQESDLSDARWLIRQRWLRPERIELLFPKHKDLISQIGRYGPSWWGDSSISLDGGTSTGLENAWAAGRAWTLHEQRWYDNTSHETCLSEIWYRRWVSLLVMTMPDGRAIEYDEKNDGHIIAVASGLASVAMGIVPRVRHAYWLGPYRLHDEPSPYTHRHFPYVPFWGFREDMTGIRYGFVRSTKYAQDSVNSGTGKLRWGMAVARTERTKGALAMSDAAYRKIQGRVDADVVLNAEHMARPGARFEVSRDFQLSDQHFQLLNDAKASIERTTGITAGFQGKQGTATSGLQEGIQVEQSNQSLAAMMDNFRAGRTQVGELLMAMIIEDIGDKEEEIIIEGDAVTEDRTVVLNRAETDEQGDRYLSNDLQRTRLLVAMEEVPSTQSYRAQQLQSMSEAVKALPPQYQAASMPFMASLMDVPFKRDFVEALRAVSAQGSPEEIEKRVREEMANELKAKELEMKGAKTEAEIKEIEARAVQVGVQAAFSAMQAGAQIAQAPVIAPLADVVMQTAGYRPPVPAGVDPNFAAPGATPFAESPPAELPEEVVDVQENTSPAFPPVPQEAESPMEGVETPRTDDNLP